MDSSKSLNEKILELSFVIEQSDKAESIKSKINKLKDEFIKEYWDGELSFEESAAINDPHSALLM